ncbi:MAG: transposase [Nitrospira sp.]|nr:transposase [Nitrospira sp.]
MTRDDKVDIILHENLKKIERAGLRPQLYLADRGFFSVACMLVFKNAGRDFLMPATKNARIRAAIERHHRGEVGAASRFVMKSAEFGKVSFNLLVVKKDKYKASDPVSDQYVAFATSLPCRTREELLETLPEAYRQRWIIETAFRVIKDVMGKTCSRRLHVRMFLFHFALLLYFLWKCTKYADMLQDFLGGGDDFTIAEFLDSVSDLTKAILLWEKNHGNFLEE